MEQTGFQAVSCGSIKCTKKREIGIKLLLPKEVGNSDYTNSRAGYMLSRNSYMVDPFFDELTRIR